MNSNQEFEKLQVRVDITSKKIVDVLSKSKLGSANGTFLLMNIVAAASVKLGHSKEQVLEAIGRLYDGATRSIEKENASS